MSISLKNQYSPQSPCSLSANNKGSKSILLVENDQRLSNILRQYLQANGYNVEPRHHLDNIEQHLAKMTADMVILDIGFSELVNLSVIKDIRRNFSGPLVLLTSRDSELEQITAFNLGVDEYLVKPISANILSVRIAALFNRYDSGRMIDDQSQITVGDLTLYPMANKCQIGEKEISLTQFEFKLLRLLADNVDKILNRDFIYKTLLNREYNGCERTVDVRVSQLREKLMTTTQQQSCIETIWGRGYMLRAC